MRTIAIINQKGGVAKTTTTISLAAGLSRKGKKVLVIDLDAQGNVGVALRSQSVKDVYDFLINTCDYRECLIHLGENLDLMTSKETLTKAEFLLVGEQNRELIFRNKLKEIVGYDYILIDCSPSLGLLNQNALLAANEAIIPTSTDILGFKALKKIILAIDSLNSVFDHDCQITKIVPTMYDKRLKVCKEILSKITNDYYEIVADPIHTCSKLKEAPSKGESIFKYAPNSQATKDYTRLVQSVIRDEQKYNVIIEQASVQKGTQKASVKA
ncbi:MAG: ParA family protein [Candidatus Woesearchaeota archaeon]